MDMQLYFCLRSAPLY